MTEVLLLGSSVPNAMATRRVRKVSVTARRIRTTSPSSLLSPLPGILTLPPLYGLYRLGQIYPTFTSSLSIYLALINVWTGVLYWHDKAQSRVAGSWRVSENSLHFCELVGGWPAALYSQRYFQHKTRKVSYQTFFWVIVVVHEMAWFWVLWVLERGLSS